MSWLSAVTGKAEDFLNRLDKSAADVLHTDEIGRLSEKHHITPEPELKTSTPSAASVGSLTPSHSVPTHLHKFGDEVGAVPAFGTSSVKASLKTQGPPPTVNITPAAGTQTSGKIFKKKNSDEALFDFLNSKDSSGNVKVRPTAESSRHHSRQSSTSSIVSSASKGPKSEGGGRGVSEVTLPPSSIRVAGNIFLLYFLVMALNNIS